MDRLRLLRALSNELRFSILCGLIIGLLCVQSGSSRSPCDPRTQFSCRTSPFLCIALSQVRDGRSDCPDGSDEECPNNMHRCICGLPRCIERSKVGDGIKHCQDGSDEGEDGSNYLCPESSGDANLFEVEMKKRRRRHTGHRNDPVVYPTGVISAFVGTEVNGDQTTLHTTQLYRTYVDGTYTEVLQSTSAVMPTPTLDSAARLGTALQMQGFGSLNSGKVYLTALNEPVSSISSSIVGSDAPIEISGTFIPPEGEITTKHFGLDLQARTVGTLFPDKSEPSIITVTGTEGMFISHDSTADKTYPVYTGSYISGQEDPTTYKFFFGNHPLTSDVRVILPTAVGATILEATETYLGEESELQGSVTNSKDVSGDSELEIEVRQDSPEPFYQPRNAKEINYNAVPTTRPEIKPIAVTRYVQPTAYPETDEPVLAFAGRNTIGVVGNVRKPHQASTLRGHQGYYRQGRMYNPEVTGRRIGQGGATVITDQFFLPGHQVETSTIGDSTEAYFREVNNAYYEINGEKLQDQLRKIVRPTAAYDRQTLKDKRLTRTVGLYGPIYEIDDLKNAFQPTETLKEASATGISTNEDLDIKDTDFTTTLFGFAEFSTRISGTQYIFLPAATQPKTFTPRVTRTSFSSGISLLPRSRNDNSNTELQPDQFFRRPLFGTETREFISQKSMFTSTVKEPVEIQKTMFTSTVMTKQPSDDRTKARKVESSTASVIAETLPLNLATIYEVENERNRAQADKDLFLNFQSLRMLNSRTSDPVGLDVSEIIDVVSESEQNIEPSNPTGLVSSITGTEISDGTTTHWTTLIIGTYIDNTYAHIIESTSSIFFTVSKTMSPEETSAMDTAEEDILHSKISSNDFLSNSRMSDFTANGVELLSSLTDVTPRAETTTSSKSSTLATPNLEILTSGFILPRSGRNNDIGISTTMSSLESSSVASSNDVSLAERRFKQSPGVKYVDDEEPSPSETSSSEEAVHIITDSFILPGVVDMSTSTALESTNANLELVEEVDAIESSNLPSVTSSFLEELDRLILGGTNSDVRSQENNSEKVNNDSDAMSTNAKDTRHEATDRNKVRITSGDEISPSIVLLTGDFILPRNSEHGEDSRKRNFENSESVMMSDISASILTEGFILPSASDSVTSTHSLSILTDGFILPGDRMGLENPKNSATTTVNALPSSALLTADFLLPNEIEESSDGRSAGAGEKEVIPDYVLLPSSVESTESINGNEKGSASIKNENNDDDLALRLGKALNTFADGPENPKVEEILPSISFPITYYTTSTYFTTYLVDGSTVVSSRKETVSQVYTDSEQLKLAKINPTETIILPQTVQPTKTVDPHLTTFTYFTTFYKDGSKIVSSRVETESDVFAETSTPSVETDTPYSVLTYPTTYYTTLTYFTTLLRGSTTEVISSETVMSNIVTPLSKFDNGNELSIRETKITKTLNPTPTTYYTTYTYYTTFHKDGTTSVSTTHQTVSNVIIGKESIESTPPSTIYRTDSAANNVEKNSKETTYFTTFTYYTTYLRNGNPVVSSREEVISNVIGKASTTPLETSLDFLNKENSKVPSKTTLYTTYTYYTTLLKDGTTTVSTRKETVSNVLNSYDSVSSFPSISLTKTPSSIVPSSSLKTFYTTYTYYTTFLRDGSSVISSRESTVSNVVTENNFSPTSTPYLPKRNFETYFTTLTSFYTLFNGGTKSVNTVYSTLTDVVAIEQPAIEITPSEAKNEATPSPVITTYYTTRTYYTTLFNAGTPVVSEREEVTSKVITLGAYIEPSTLVHAITPFELRATQVQPTALITKTYYTTYTFFTTFLSKGSPSVSTRLETVTNYVSEAISSTKAFSKTNEILPTSTEQLHYFTSIHDSFKESLSPVLNSEVKELKPRTHYTTFTYFTTLLSDGSSVVQSRTHVVSSVLNQPDTTNNILNVPSSTSTSRLDITPTATATNTVYTTFTYYTTLFSNGSPVVKTRFETSSNIVTVTITPTSSSKVSKVTSDLEAAEGGLHEKRVHPTPVVTYYTTHTYVTTSIRPDGGTGFITRQVVASASIDQGGATRLEPSLQKDYFHSSQYPYTFYTTYTYFTTRFHGERPIINTRYETITNVIKAPIPVSTQVADIRPSVTKIETFDALSNKATHEHTFLSPAIKEPVVENSKKPEGVKSRKGDEKEEFLTTHISDSESESLEENQENNSKLVAVTIPYSVTTDSQYNESVTTPNILTSPEVTSDNSEETVFTNDSLFTTEMSQETSTDNSELNMIPDTSSTENLSTTVTESGVTISKQNETTVSITSESTEGITVTENITSLETTTTTETPIRSIFSRRRNRPQYKPRPSFRSTTTITSTTTKSPRKTITTTTRGPPTSSLNRRNSTRLLFRRPSLAPRINPLQRLRPIRPIQSSTTPSEETSNRKRRSFYHPEEEYVVKPNIRKLLSTSEEENSERILKNNDLVLDKSSGSQERRNTGKEDYPLGLIRSMESRAINNGITTVYATEVHGTFINGVYAQVVQSKVKVYTDSSNEIEKTPNFAPSISPTYNKPSATETNKIGLVSSKISTAIKDGLTTVYTTNIFGTYIGDVYAHLAQTTSKVIQPTPATKDPYPTGLISTAVRSEENYGTTTYWTTHIYGTFVNNYYAHIASTFSNVYANADKNTAQATLGFQNQLYAQATPDIRSPSPTARSLETSKHKTGFLSSIVSEDENYGTTTQYITNIYGTYIGEHYAKHAQTTSKVIVPSKVETATRSVGLLSTITNSAINGNTVTLYKTEIFGTYIGQLYAQLARTSTEYKIIPTNSYEISTTPQLRQKTGLLSSSVVRSEINAGTTTMHINEIYGTYIGNAYAHIAKSTSKIIKPTESGGKSPSSDVLQRTGLISSSVKTEVNDGTTTLHIAEVHGTYVGNYYAHVARRTSTVLPLTPSITNVVEPTPTTVNLKSEGLISSDIRTEVNIGTTTLYTREIYGTYINGFYAHVARSSSNIIDPTSTAFAPNTGLVSSITSSEINNGILTVHTTEIYGTRINGFYAHIARSTSNVISNTPSPTEAAKPLGVISATISTEINKDTTTVHRTSVIGMEVDGTYIQSIKKTSSVLYASQIYPSETIKIVQNSDSKTLLQPNIAKDDLDTARVNELDNGNQYISLTEDSDLGLKTPLSLPTEFDLLSPSINSNIPLAENTKETPSTASVTEDETFRKNFDEKSVPLGFSESSTLITKSVSTLSLLAESSETEPSKTMEKEEKSSKLPSEDYNDYNDYVDNKTFRDKDSITAKPNVREPASPRKNKVPTISSSRKSSPEEDYDDYPFEDDYDDIEGRKPNQKVTPSVASSRFKNTRQSKRKSTQYNNRDYDEYDDYDYNESEISSIQPSKSSESSTTKETPSSSVRIRPFTGRGRPTYTTPSRSSSKASYTIQFRRPSRTRNSRAFGSRSDSENDFDDELSDEEEEGDIEASEAVVTTATPQVLSFSRRKPFGSSRYQPPGRNSGSSTTPRPLTLSRNRRPFGRSTTATSPSPTPSLKDTVPDYDENTTEDDDFDDYDDINDKKDLNRNRNFRSTRRPPSRLTRYGERRSASNKRGSFRHREEEETENDDFDSTTPNYRNSRNRINQRKPSRGRYNRNNSPSLKSSFNSVSRDEDEDSQSLQPLNRVRNNNRNRRPSYNPRTRRPSKAVSETQTIKKPYLTVTSVVTTVKTLPIYHGFRTSYATLTTTALDTSIINPTQYSEVVSDGVTKTLFYSKTGYPDGIENLHTTITEVVVTTTSLASVKLVPIKIGFSTRTDTITDIQVLTTLSTVYSTITPDTPQPTAFPQQFQPNFYPQLGPQNPDFGLIASANSFVTTQIVTSTTVIPIILRGRTILSTLTTTSTAESTVVQTVRLPQVPSAAPFIPQPYFAFQPLTTLLTLYVTGEHGELKPVITTVTVPLYQQPVFHTKVARSLQQSAVSEPTLKTADILDMQLRSSIGQAASKDIDIDTHYDKLLSSGLEEINDLSEISHFHWQTEPLDGTRISSGLPAVTTYDVTTISKGPLTEIYEQKVTVNLESADSSVKQNEIEENKDMYGLESRYTFRKLQQFIEEEPVFRPQRDFTRLRRPPAGVILATATNPNILLQPETQNIPLRNRPRQTVALRRPPAEISSDNVDAARSTFRGPLVERRPQRRPEGNFRPFIGRPVAATIAPVNELNRPNQPPSQLEPSSVPLDSNSDIEKVQDLLSSLQNANRNLNTVNGFSGSPADTENIDGFRPLAGPSGPRRGPAPPGIEDAATPPVSNFRPRRLRVTRPVNGEFTNSGLRRITRVRIPEVTSTASNQNENDIAPTLVVSPSSTRSEIQPSRISDFGEDPALEIENVSSDEEETTAGRRTIIRRLRPSFVPGDGSGARRPVVIRRTRVNDQSVPPTAESSANPVVNNNAVDIKETLEDKELGTVSSPANENENENEDVDGSEKPPVKKVVRLRKPQNGDSLPSGQRRRIVVSRRPQDNVISSSTLQARGPVSTSTNKEGQNNNFISDNNHLYPNGGHDLEDFNRIAVLPNQDKEAKLNSIFATKNFPITYFTTLTYFTTFLHGPDTNYASRVAIFSNVIDQTLNPNLINAIKSNADQRTGVNPNNVVHLASRTLGDTTTIVNLASHQNIYNSEVYKLLNDGAATNEIKISAILPTSTQNINAPSKTNIFALAALPKTYLTLFTYSYTFFDGDNRRESTRAETMTNVASDPNQFLTESIGSYINQDGLLNVGPETRTVHLGSREVKGTTTEVNLGLKTLIKVDGARNVVIERTQVQPFQYVTPSRTVVSDTQTSQVQPSHLSRPEILPPIILESSYASANDLFGTNQPLDTATETSPLFSSAFNGIPDTDVDKIPIVKVTSVIHKPTGPLRSGVFVPRPGVRVRVRPVVSRRLVPSELASSFDISFDVNNMASDKFSEPLASPQYIPPGINMGEIPTPVLETPYLTTVLVSPDVAGGDNEIVSEEFEVEDGASTEGAVVPSKKKLKVTVRRPQSESVSRTHTRFVLPSRFEITSRPRFYVVTRTGALGVVSNSQRPFTVKISRKLKPTATELGPPSTTVIYDTFTTLTSVPVIFGLDTSFRNVLLTTSSPITVSFVPTPTYDSDSSVIMPSTVVLTYFTTTTFTIPYIVGDETLLTTLEETNSRVVTQTLDGLDSLQYSTVTRTLLGGDVAPTISPVTSIEFGFDGPITHTLSSAPFIPTYEEYPTSTLSIFYESPSPAIYETKTFYTTYTFFSTFFAGTDTVVSSSEQVVTNVVTVPLATDASQISSASSAAIGPITVFDTSETVITKTDYNTVTFYATLFSDTSSFVTPIEEVETQIKTITETFTITRTILPTPSASLLPISTTTTATEVTADSEPSVVVTQTLYTTFTNFVTLFQGADTVVTNIEEVVSNVVTMTVPAHAASSFIVKPTSTVSRDTFETSATLPTSIYTTREVLSTQTHYLTLFNNGDSLLSSIEEVVTTYVTELASPFTPSYELDKYLTASPEIVLLSSKTLTSPSESFTVTSVASTEESTTEIQTYHPELVPSIRTIYSTLTFYTTYFSDTSSIIASQEEVLTSFITLFVPPSLITTTTETTTEKPEPTSTFDPSVFVFTTTDYSTLTLYTTLFSGDEIVVISSEHVVPEVITATITPSSVSPTETATKDESVLTFLTTFTYYTTYFSGVDPVIASSESVVTQFVTIEAPPSLSSTLETSIQSTTVSETIIGVSTASGGDISSSFKDDLSGIEIIGVSSIVATNTAVADSVETKIQVESKVHVEVGSTSIPSSPTISSSTTETVSKVEDINLLVPTDTLSKLLEKAELESTLSSSAESTLSDHSEKSRPITSTSIVTEKTEIIGLDGQITTLTPSDTLKLVTGTDGFITKLAEIGTISLSPVFIPSEEIVPSVTSSSEIKPATVIELSDLLGGNTALGGDIGLAIQDIVSLITGKKNKTDTEGTTTESSVPGTEDSKMAETTTETSENTESSTESDTAVTGGKETESNKMLPKDADYPIFILPSSATVESESSSSEELAPVYVPPETKETPVKVSSTHSEESITKETLKTSKTVSTSIITGARTVFIVPTKSSSDANREENTHSIVLETATERRTPKLDSSKETVIDSSKTSDENEATETPELKASVGTSIISGIRTVFFGSNIGVSSATSLESTEESSPTKSILGRANAPLETSKSFTTVTKNGQTVISRTTSGATTIFFPGQIPKYSSPVTSTRYITSVESITRTLALTTTRTYYTRDSTLTVPSVYTTTIPPRTFVSTIIGSRTILGILPEPTERVQIHKTIQPSERTTTVTTTTLIFNSIPSTVVRTLVLPSSVPTKTIKSETSSTYTISDSNVFSAGTERPAKPPEVGDSTSITILDPNKSDEKAQLVKPIQKTRDDTYLRAAGPRLHEFRPDTREEDSTLRPPIVITEEIRPEDDPFLNGRNGVCDPKCQPYKKEICRENEGLWTCQCRPGHARSDDHEVCKEIQTFVVLLRVVKMGNDSINYNSGLADSNSQQFKEFVRNAKEGIADVYSITNVKDHIWEAEVNDIMPAETLTLPVTESPIANAKNGVIVNFTMQVSKSISGNLLEQELTRSLQLTHMRVGDSLLLAAPLSQSILDYDECIDFRQNDCALRATCINLPGTFTCKCNDSFEDMDTVLPGRTCLAKTENCNYCHGRGDCLRADDEKTFCRCQPMFVGRRCEINGLVLAIALPTAVAVVILLLCAVLCCCRKCKRKTPSNNTADPGSVFRGIALKGPVGGTLDRKAMIDTSSESSGEHGRKGQNSFEGYQESGDVTPYKSSKRSDLSLNRSMSTGYTSPPVMIPRARQPQVPNKPMNYTVYDGQVYVW